MSEHLRGVSIYDWPLFDYVLYQVNIILKDLVVIFIFILIMSPIIILILYFASKIFKGPNKD